MKKCCCMVISAILMFASVFAAEVTRTTTLAADQESALFAVPNGYSFTRAYATDTAGGTVPVSVGEATVMNHVTLIPVALNAGPSSVLADGTRQVTVVFTDNGELFTGRPAKVMREAIKEKVANPEDVPTTQYVAPTRSKLKLSAAPLAEGGQSPSGADVLILSPHDNVILWKGYADFRKSTAAGTDLTFKVVDLNTVYETYPWTGDSPSAGVRNAAEAIHKYLRENCDNLGVSYVILGGSWINAQHLNGSDQWTNTDGEVIYLQDGEAMSLANCVPGVMANPRQGNVDPSDMFYACLDLTEGQTYPWCDGSSSTYFENVNDATKRAKYDAGVDVVVARMPLKPTTINGRVYTAAELMNAFTNKITRAEQADFSGTGRLGSLWGQVGKTLSVDGSLPSEFEFYDDADNMFDEDRLNRGYQDAEVAQRVMIKDHVAKYYPVRAVDTLSGLLWSKGYATFNEAVAAYFASDRDYAGIDSHGWAGGAEALNCDNFNTATGITLLNDVSVPCETGYQDRTGSGSGDTAGRTVAVPCAGEAAVQGPAGGAIASLNNSRTGLTGSLGSNSLSYLLYHESAKAFLHQGKNSGQTWLSAHLAFIGLSEVTSGAQTGSFEGGGGHTLEEHTLFGDPLIKSQVNRADGQLAANTSVSGVSAYINAASTGDLTLAGSGRIKILQTLSVGGTSFTAEDGVEGGVGQKVVFTGEKGVVTLKTTKRFYLGGVSNATEIRVSGDNAIIDCDRLTNVDKIVFEMSSAATNVLRGITKDALAHTTIESTGGTLLFESSDVLGGTSVKLEGTTIVLGSDPATGSLVASGEPLRGTFSGSGIIKYKHGTELMKDWTITGSVQTIDDGSEIEPGLLYSGLVGQNPTGWFTSWVGEAFNANHAVLGPKGFVGFVESEGNHHPHANLAAKKGFTLSLYADLSRVSTSADAVMLSLGSANDAQNSQLLLMCNGGRVKLVVTNGNGTGEKIKYSDLFEITPGYHLYTIERVVSTKALKVYVDGVNKLDTTSDFSLGTGLQLGSQYGGLKNSRAKAIGMAVAGLIGFDAVLTDDEMSAHVADYPARGLPFNVAESVDLSSGNDVQAELVSATFSENTYLGANNGAMTIPSETTVSVPGVKLLNASQGGNIASLTVNGILNVTGESTANGPYRDFATGVNAGIMLGHWGGSSTLTIGTDGRVNAPNGDLLIGYTASGVVDVNGGTLTVKGLTNYSAPSNILNDKGSVLVQNGGVLEVAAWPVKSATQLGTMPITFNNGILRGTADWTCPRPLTVSGPLTIDCAGHNLIFSGAISGAGAITVTDSSDGKTGSVIFVSSFEYYTNKITVDASVTKFGVRKEYVGSSKISFATRPATLIVALSASQLTESYTASSYANYVTAGSKIVFTDYDGYVYQDTEGTNVFTPWKSMTYNYDGIDWSYVYLPYERGIWAPLINWRTLWSNDSATNSVQQFSSGLAPLLTGSNRWAPAILNGNEFEGEKDEDGFYNVRADQLEGWNMKLGVYNGVHLTVGKQVKFQTDSTHYLRVGTNSRITFESFGSGNNSGDLPIRVASPDGVVFKTDVPNKTYEYYLTNGGTVKFEQGLNSGTHKVKEVHATQVKTSGDYYNLMGVKIADFNNKDSSARFMSENGALKLDGFSGTTRYLANSLAVLNDAKTNGIGAFTLMQGDAGVYAMYAEKSATPPTELTINGNQTNIDLANLPYETITKIKIAGAWGYFKDENHTISTQVEFNDTAAGLPAFRWENGYSDKYVAFANATGHGTIFINGGTKTSQAMIFTGGDFDGSIILTNGNNRVYFGEAADVGRASASRIEVKSGATATLKDGGTWAAGGLTDGSIVIDGTLNCKGSAQLICMPGITGVENITIPSGYKMSLLTVTPDANPSAARTVRVWVLPEGEIPTAEGQLGLGVTDSKITLPSFDMGEYKLRVLGKIVVGVDAAVRAPDVEMVTNEQGEAIGSFAAAAKVGDTYYGSFANAVTAAENGAKTITLLQNVENYDLAAGKRLVINKNEHTITFAQALTVEETGNDDGSVAYLSTSTRYNIVYHVKNADGTDWDVSSLSPTSFATEHLPIDLPSPTAADKVFHGWYASYENGEYTDGPQTRLERMARDNELHRYGYWLAAVATVNKVPYDNWEDAIEAQHRTGYSIVALDTSRLPAGYFVNDSGYLVQIQATVLVGYPQVQTAFSSFAEARAFAKGKEDAYISLSANATSPLVLDNDETVRVALNKFTLDVKAADPDNYNVKSSNDDAPWILTYCAYHRDVILTLPTLPDGVTATVSTNGIAIAANEAGNYIVHYNAEVTITYTVAGAFTLNKTTETLTADGDKTAGDFTAPVKTAAVAQRGSAYFASVTAALAGATTGETVTVLNNPEADALTVPAGVTLDLNGQAPTGGYTITLNGGSLRGSVANAHYGTIKSLMLTANSSIGTEDMPLDNVFGIGVGQDGGATIDLGGNTLHVYGKAATNFFFEKVTCESEGTINIHEGRTLVHCNGFSAPNVKMIVGGTSNALIEGGLTVKSLDIETSGTVSVSAGKTLTFTDKDTKKYLDAAYMHKITLGSGATFDYGWQPGKVISINFNAISETDPNWMSGDTIDMTFAGQVPRSSWVNTTGGTGNNIAVGQYWDSDANQSQTISGMTIGYRSNGTWYPSSATLPFMKGYLDISNHDGGTHEVEIDLAGIPFKKYDLIIYYQGDGSSGFRPVKVTHNYGATTETYGYDSAFRVVKTGYTDPWGQGNLADIAYEKNAIRMNGLIGSVLKIGPLERSTVRPSVAAIQIVENTEGIVTYRRNPEATSNDWMVDGGWLDPQGNAVTWSDPDLTSGQIYTAEIDADLVDDIKLTSQVTASLVVVKNAALSYTAGAKSFKFLTSESLSTLLDEDPDAPILNAPVDTTGFCGDLYLQSRIGGALSLGQNAHITFVSDIAGEETTAYPYTFVGTMAPIRMNGPGSFLVPSSMYNASFNVTGGSIKYDYSGDSAKTVSGALSGAGKLVKTGSGELIFSTNGSISGGTTIEAGTLTLGAQRPLGNQGANVLVKTGATLDLGCKDNHGINLTLDGGTLKNTGSSDAALGQVHFKSITLTKDSTVDLERRTGVLNNGWDAANLNLNGCTLTKRGTGEFLVCNTTVSSGAIRFEAGGLRSSGRDAAYVSNASNLSAADVVIAGTGITFAGFNPTVKSLTFEGDGSIAAAADNDATITTSSLSGSGTANKLALANGATKDGGNVTVTGSLAFGDTLTVNGLAHNTTLFTLGEDAEVPELPTLDGEYEKLINDNRAIKYVIARASVNGVYYPSLAEAIAASPDGIVDILDGSMLLPDEYADTYVIVGTQAWKKRDVYARNTSPYSYHITNDSNEDSKIELRTGDTIVLKQSLWVANRWILKNLTSGYPIKIDSETDIDSIQANTRMTITYKNYPETGDKKGVYLRGDIGANTMIDGDGALFVGFENNKTIADGVVVSCDFGFQSGNKSVTINANATFTLNGDYNHVEGSSIKLNDGATLKYLKEGHSKLADNVVVPALGGRILTMEEVDGYYVYTTEIDYTKMDEKGNLPHHWYKFSNNYDSCGEAAITFNGTKPGDGNVPYVIGVVRGTDNTAIQYNATADMYYSNVSYGDGDWTAVGQFKLLASYLSASTEYAIVGYGSTTQGTMSGVAIIGLLSDGVPAVKLKGWINNGTKTDSSVVKVPDAAAKFMSYAVQYDSATQAYKLFIDGVEKTSLAMGDDNTAVSGHIQFGGAYGGGLTRGGAVLDDWRVYQSKLDTDYLKVIAEGMADQNNKFNTEAINCDGAWALPNPTADDVVVEGDSIPRTISNDGITYLMGGHDALVATAKVNLVEGNSNRTLISIGYGISSVEHDINVVYTDGNKIQVTYDGTLITGANGGKKEISVGEHTITFVGYISGASRRGAYVYVDGAILTYDTGLQWTYGGYRKPYGKVVFGARANGTDNKAVGIRFDSASVRAYDYTDSKAIINLAEEIDESAIPPAAQGQIIVKYGEMVLNSSEQGATKYVDVSINDQGKVALTTTPAAVPAVGDVVMTLPGAIVDEHYQDQVRFTVDNPIPGLFYSIVAADEPTDAAFAAVSEQGASQATSSDAKILMIQMPDMSATNRVKYFRVRVKAMPR